jgi:hypothetical protein
VTVPQAAQVKTAALAKAGASAARQPAVAAVTLPWHPEPADYTNPVPFQSPALSQHR